MNKDEFRTELKENEKRFYTDITSANKAIRQFCLDCCGGSADTVRHCTPLKCALYPFRMGFNPYNTKTLTDEQRAATSERIKAYHANKE